MLRLVDPVSDTQAASLTILWCGYSSRSVPCRELFSSGHDDSPQIGPRRTLYAADRIVRSACDGAWLSASARPGCGWLMSIGEAFTSSW